MCKLYFLHVFRKAIPSAERLCLTLYYLTYSGSQQSLSFSFRIAKSIIYNLLRYQRDMQSHLGLPEWAVCTTTKNKQWLETHCQRFRKHMESTALYWCNRWKARSLYHNYKGIFSIVLMAIAMLATYSLGLITIAECFVTRLWEKRFLIMKWGTSCRMFRRFTSLRKGALLFSGWWVLLFVVLVA